MSKIRYALLFLALALAAPAAVRPATAQMAAEQAAETWPEADPEDVESIDAILAALYDVISGPAGETRDWDRFRSLHIPQARLIPTGRNAQGRFGHRVMSIQDFVDTSGPVMEERGFFESEVARTTERFGSIAHAFSTYESRWTLEDPEPFQRGINSIQLMHDGARWYVMNIFWAGETADTPIPARYLDGDR
jgi:hypothetical protein